jgi:uncharacterized protein YggL (DUF469 family)
MGTDAIDFTVKCEKMKVRIKNMEHRARKSVTMTDLTSLLFEYAFHLLKGDTECLFANSVDRFLITCEVKNTMLVND